MSKFAIIPEIELHPFKDALGTLFGKVCNDAKAFIGRLESNNEGKDVKSILSGTSVTSKGVLKSKEGYTLQMPLNNPMTFLVLFGMQLTKLDNSMDNRKLSQDKKTVESGGIQSRIPSVCQDWIEQQRNELKQGTAKVVA